MASSFTRSTPSRKPSPGSSPARTRRSSFARLMRLKVADARADVEHQPPLAAIRRTQVQSAPVAMRVVHHARRHRHARESRARSAPALRRARSPKRPPARRAPLPAAPSRPSAAGASCPPIPRPAPTIRRRAPGRRLGDHLRRVGRQNRRVPCASGNTRAVRVMASKSREPASS